MPGLPSNDRIVRPAREYHANLFSEDYDKNLFSEDYAKNLFSEEDNGNILRRGVNHKLEVEPSS
jgi:hypothetical protein